MKILHPFMPFITEEIWHELRKRDEKDCIIVASWPNKEGYDETIIENMDEVFEVISGIRNIRSTREISPKQTLKVFIKTKDNEKLIPFHGVMQKMANLSEIEYTDEKVENCDSFIIKGDEFSIPMEGLVDSEHQKQKLLKELEYTKGFLAGVEKKLSNERFVQNAPEKVIEVERKKKFDAEAKIRALEESLASL
jgi:valyl-tRNA synthetase